MDEIRRILFNKKIIIIFFIFTSLCLGMFFYSQYQTAEFNSISFSDANNYRAEIYKNLRDKKPSYALEYVESQWDYYTTINELINYNEIKNKDYQSFTELWMSDELELRNRYPEFAQYYDNNKNNIDSNEYRTKEFILTEIQTQIKYLVEYPTYLKSIDDKAKQMTAISIFQKRILYQ